MDTLLWLQNWYYQHCNGDWEHTYGVKIDTIDNPGWSVEINLVETCLENEHFDSIDIERDEENWYYCNVRDGKFIGAGGARNLEEILNSFRQWAMIKELK
ncbi:Imm53 family immunity protein [Paenibacillus sp. FSL K6-1558]|uniref:Imm53 family immunity protein n=1 Tax=Paenibacillus sp. FSL K6-1558 TaxID=2921473 RepID=UPI0012B6E16A|nr:immunity 53 family protein [Paenibacillus xylanexedens]